jgi:iron complex transport system substrate-binding protein
MNNKRVVSLSPGCTEILCALGCARQLAGRSHKCDWPQEAQPAAICTTAPIDRSTPSDNVVIDFARIATLQPDLILHSLPQEIPSTGSAQIRRCNASRIPDLWANIQAIAEALDVVEKGAELTLSLKNRVVDILLKTCAAETHPTVACIDRLAPLTTPGLWVPELVGFAGGSDAFGKAGHPSAPLAWSALVQRDPEILIFMPTGFDLAQTRTGLETIARNPEWARLRALKKRSVYLIDSRRFFTRTGPSAIDSLEILAEIISPKDFHFGWEGKRWMRF